MAVNIISSMQNWLGGPPSEEERRAAQIEPIRQAMLESFGGGSPSASFPQLESRILLAADLQSLWYLRSDLMAALSSLQGEFTARHSLQDITSMFEGLLPKNMFSRPTPRRH